MKIDSYFILDIGQTHIKYYLVNSKNFKIEKKIIFKNIYYNKFKNYNIFNYNKFKKDIFTFLKLIKKKYNLLKITSLSFGSTSFFIDTNNHVCPIILFNNKEDSLIENEYKKILPPYSRTLTPLLPNYHNLGKQIFFMKKKFNIKKNFQIASLSNILAFIFSQKSAIDHSYLACHSHLFDFKTKKVSSLFSKLKINDTNIVSPYSYSSQIKKSVSRYLGINEQTKIFYGCHDTNSSYFYHKKIFKKNFDVLCTGTWFVYLSETCKIKYKRNNHNIYGNYSVDKKILNSFRFDGGIEYSNFNKVFKDDKFDSIYNINYSKLNKILLKNYSNIKNINKNHLFDSKEETKIIISLQIALKVKMNLNLIGSKNKIIIDGNFVFNKYFIFFLSILCIKQKIFCYYGLNSALDGAIASLNKKFNFRQYHCINIKKLEISNIVKKISLMY